jgi:release factor glutamine methyltransferase
MRENYTRAIFFPLIFYVYSVSHESYPDPLIEQLSYLYYVPNLSQSMPHHPDQVYIPAEDTYLLLEVACREVCPVDRVLEIGAGSGFIAAALEKVAALVVATDINPHAAAYVSEQGIDVVRTDLCSGVQKSFDLVIFNPPYLPTQPEERIHDWLECSLNGGETGREVIERFAVEISRVLAPAGRILLLISSLTGLQDVSGIFLRQGFSVAIAREQLVEDEVLYVLKIARLSGG